MGLYTVFVNVMSTVDCSFNPYRIEAYICIIYIYVPVLTKVAYIQYIAIRHENQALPQYSQ